MPKRKWDAFKNDPRTISLPTSQSKSKIDEIELLAARGGFSLNHLLCLGNYFQMLSLERQCQTRQTSKMKGPLDFIRMLGKIYFM